MSKLEDKAVEVIDKSMIGVERLTEKMAELAAQYGPDVVNAGIEVARFTAAGKLFGAIWFVIAGFALSFVAIKLMRVAKEGDKKDTHESWALERRIPAGILFVSAAVCFFETGLRVFNIWNWVGIVEPKLWIAHRILEKAL